MYYNNSFYAVAYHDGIPEKLLYFVIVFCVFEMPQPSFVSHHPSSLLHPDRRTQIMSRHTYVHYRTRRLRCVSANTIIIYTVQSTVAFEMCNFIQTPMVVFWGVGLIHTSLLEHVSCRAYEMIQCSIRTAQNRVILAN